MPSDALHLFAQANYLNSRLEFGRIDRILQPQNDTVILCVYAQKENRKLFISANPNNPAVYFANKTPENPLNAPSFCMLLRKHLLNANIESIKTFPYERAFEFVFMAKNELNDSIRLRLIVEAVQRYPNIILTDNDYTIIDCLRHIPLDASASRLLFPRAKYVPLSQKDDKFNIADTKAFSAHLRNFTPSSGQFGGLRDYILKRLYGLSAVSVDEALANCIEYLDFLKPSSALRSLAVKETKPDDTKQNDTRFIDTELDETKQNETRFVNTKPDETKQNETRLANTKLDETKQNETRFIDTELDETKSLASLSETEITAIINSINALYHLAENADSRAYLLGEKDFALFPFKSLAENINTEIIESASKNNIKCNRENASKDINEEPLIIKEYPNIDSAMCEYFTLKNTHERMRTELKKINQALKSAISKHEKRITQIMSKLNECADKDKFRLYGELLTNYIYLAKDWKGQNEVKLLDYNTNSTVCIPLDPKLQAKDNAGNYFKKYAKLKRSEGLNLEQLNDTKEHLDYLLSIRANAELALTTDDLNELYPELEKAGLLKSATQTRKGRGGKNSKANLPEGNPHIFEYKGYTIRAGKNNLQNDRLTFKSASNDIWLHALGTHGSHVIISKKGAEPIPEDVIRFSAQIAAFFSKSRQSDKVAVDYTLVKNVKKPPKSLPGKVIYFNQNTIFVNPSEFKSLPT